MGGQDPDVIVIGAGPNGLGAAHTLAKHGLRVLVVEASARPGGAVWTVESTLPGFQHDVGAAFFPFAHSSPALQQMNLKNHGLTWHNAPLESCHPAPDGTSASLARDLDVMAKKFGSEADGAAMRALAQWHRQAEPAILRALLGTFPPLGAVRGLLPSTLPKLAWLLARSGRSLAQLHFSSEPARRVLPGLALHVDVGPDDRFGAGLAYMLGLTATTGGFSIPKGGAGAITRAMVSAVELLGGVFRFQARVVRVLAHGGVASGVVLADGTELRARHGVMANVSAPSLFLDLVDRAYLPGHIIQAMQRFAPGFATFKMDWALSAPVPWTAEDARQSAVVHVGDSVDDLARFTAQVRAGQLPDNPYLVVGQQSLVDSTRAPAGKHTLWAYSRVPAHPEGGWAQWKDAFADTVEARLEKLAPGFRATVLKRHVVTPPDLEAMDANLRGGDLGGGSNAWNHQLIFRPVFPYFRYATPLPRLYLCSSYAHPGAGVHAMAGHNAALALLGRTV